MDFTEVQKVGSRLGTGTMIVLDDRTCPVGMVLNLEHFFAQESCGWCTPCWSGLAWVERILQAMENGRGMAGDLDKLASQTRSSGRVTLSARSRPVRPNRCKARSSIFAKTSSGTSLRSAVRGPLGEPSEIGGGRISMAKVYIDGRPYEMDSKQNLLHGCLSLGFDLPYFCWHPATAVRWVRVDNAPSRVQGRKR